ncbi:MAG: glycosyltransferase [Acidobacteriaceae bacterium]|nr:glycosyltransferase [Acidobacteriaceae bacterium]
MTETDVAHTFPASVCVVVPCYNEARRLDTARFRAFLSRASGARLLFVDDGSSDGTLGILEELRQEFNGCATVLALNKNGGKAEAVRQGVLHALDAFRPEVVGFWDADLATPLESIAPLLAVLNRDAEIEMVFGARVKLLGRHVERRALRHYLGRIFATAVSTALALPIYDTQCGAKLFRVRPETRQIFAEPFLSRWVFDVEIIARYLNLYQREHRSLETAIYEYPLESWVDVAGSKVHPTDFFVAFWDVLKIRRHYLL